MSCIVFILLGLAVCGFTHALFNSSRIAVIVDLGVAVIGAVTVGALFNHIAATGAAVVSITDAFVAAVTGAVGLLAARQQMLTIRAGERSKQTISRCRPLDHLPPKSVREEPRVRWRTDQALSSMLGPAA